MLIIIGILFSFSSVLASSLPCGACVAVMAVVEGEIETKNSTKVLDALAGVCAHLSSPTLRRDCDKVADAAAGALPGLRSFLNERLYHPYALCSMLSLCQIDCCGVRTGPEQISVSYDGGSLHVTWVMAANASDDQTVHYALDSAGHRSGSPLVAKAVRTTYTSGGWVGAIFHAELPALKSGAVYLYRVGGDRDGWSEQRAVRVPPTAAHSATTGQEITLRTLLVADMGAEKNSDPTVQALMRIVAGPASPNIDLVLHAGDEAYADGYERQWDIYGRKIEPFSSRVPVMYIPGNHEIVYNFTAYKTRMAMPGASSGSNTNLYWSTQVGPVHLVGLNSERTDNTPLVSDQQIAWLHQDLTRATAPAQRARYPWLVVMIHRPLYCVVPGGFPSWHGPNATCDYQASYLRRRLDAIFVNYRVDLVLSGHNHNFQRFYPYSESAHRLVKSYDKPGIPVHYVMGASGCREGIDKKFYSPLPPWVVRTEAQRGYSTLDFNLTAAVVRFFSVEHLSPQNPTGTLTDEFVLRK